VQERTGKSRFGSFPSYSLPSQPSSFGLALIWAGGPGVRPHRQAQLKDRPRQREERRVRQLRVRQPFHLRRHLPPSRSPPFRGRRRLPRPRYLGLQRRKRPKARGGRPLPCCLSSHTSCPNTRPSFPRYSRDPDRRPPPLECKRLECQRRSLVRRLSLLRRLSLVPRLSPVPRLAVARLLYGFLRLPRPHHRRTRRERFHLVS
jgi:hypothetical protein